MVRLLTPEEVCEITQLKRQTVYNLLQTSRLKSINTSIGKRPTYRIPEDALAKFLTLDNTQPEAAPQPEPAIAPEPKQERVVPRRRLDADIANKRFN